MARKRKTKTDTASGAVDLMRADMPQPPPHITILPEIMPFWESVVTAKAYESWNATDLEHAAVLARCKYELERLTLKVAKSKKPVVDNDTHRIIDNLTRRVVALSRLLHIHALATVGQSADQRKKNQTHKEAKS